MKKYISILLLLLFLSSCQTKEQIENQKKQEEINKITAEINKEEISEEAKTWLINAKTKEMVTVLCTTTSKKCLNLKLNIDTQLKKQDIIINFVYLDDTDESTKQIIKTTYDLIDYASYTPYMFITNKDKLLLTDSDFTYEQFIENLKQTKIISK